MKFGLFLASLVSLQVISATSPLFATDDGLFKPGSIAQQHDLNPPDQDNTPQAPSFWVEEGVKLHKFEGGLQEGKVALVIHGGPCGPYVNLGLDCSR